MSEKYLLSVCFKDINNDIFSEPFGPFESFNSAEEFADNQIYELRMRFAVEFGNIEDVDEHFEFDFCIKKIS
jgi:hypothetical protein